jgi:hypothetical protein
VSDERCSLSQKGKNKKKGSMGAENISIYKTKKKKKEKKRASASASARSQERRIK